MNQVHHMKPITSLLLASVSGFCLIQSVGASETPAGSLLTADQEQVDKVALALRDDPGVKAATDAGFKRWSALQGASGRDAVDTLKGAIEEAQYSALRSVAAYDPGNPKVVWVSAPPYAYGSVKVPGSRYAGDSPDRIYRGFAVDPSHRYELHGQRQKRPSNDDFSFEAIPTISLEGQPVAALKEKDVDVAADGTFTIALDSSPASGQRNHLTLPAGTKAILVRDTLADWSTQLPNQIAVKRVDTAPVPARTQDELHKQAAEAVTNLIEANIRFLDQISKIPVNQPRAQVRKPQDGVAGAIAGGSRFSFKSDEALVITVDPAGARYVGFQLTDPWFRSRLYWSTTGSLSKQQVKANSDGSLTYVIAAADPGYYNWLDTGGLHDGLLLVRVENFDQTPDPEKVIREAKVVKLARLASAVPPDAVLATPAERKLQLADRHSGYLQRVAR